ncbi:GNAT family N-acetyltransferase [Clostridium botulinum]|uniref:Acetyltransferase n=1 Tax=Clostridium botulinum C/D str. DC5 TaxID=1443128 RepID=A0A0A0IF15_CLOBO|nr:GNAT family N-acetyltransferase [Clostridium botulinum]KGN00050.1 acetyltransferase [Clostridium botulinum C/D str. DC5]KOC55717.1 acetyltransferase [Clostridium botulinum]KOC57220.1 acetyltransferase [Clostridium botulinum]MCD3234476.1 GNAT family N-acetyltransferase [Clostridium botulinum D/C]MCD3240372.1 GNAT family N-acetyltransferase [Clostridium botulinum D/C]
MIKIDEINNKLCDKVITFIEENWSSSIMIFRGKVHNIAKLPGYLYIINGEIQGLITYEIEDEKCEIVSLDSLNENKGIGSNLIEKVIETANYKKCKEVWLITTNDNIRAIRFYQKREFDMSNIYINAVNEARKLKPEIPLRGYDDIPILHEIEFKKDLGEF